MREHYFKWKVGEDSVAIVNMVMIFKKTDVVKNVLLQDFSLTVF